MYTDVLDNAITQDNQSVIVNIQVLLPPDIILKNNIAACVKTMDMQSSIAQCQPFYPDVTLMDAKGQSRTFMRCFIFEWVKNGVNINSGMLPTFTYKSSYNQVSFVEKNII